MAQADAADELARRHADAPLTGRLEADASRVLGVCGALFASVARAAPEALGEEARERAAEPEGTARERLLTYWSGAIEAKGDYLSRALLRPYVELLAHRRVAPDRLHRPGHCPFCGGAPLVSARRPVPESHGADRMLLCALCGTEWLYARIQCPACEEGNPDRLPTFRDERHPLVRVEACDVCRRYVKSIDLTLDGRPLPEVDDLASISMDLWAGEQGYTRIEPGLAGI